MELLVNTLASEVGELHENGVRLNAIGDLDSLPTGCRTALKKAMDHTAGNDRITLTLALSYSARWDILRMVRGVANDIKEGRIGMHDIDEKAIERTAQHRRHPPSGAAGAHQRRAPHQQLPALGDRLRRTLVHARALARFPERSICTRPCWITNNANAASAAPANNCKTRNDGPDNCSALRRSFFVLAGTGVSATAQGLACRRRTMATRKNTPSRASR
jgi:hypothetical protein